MSRSPWSSSARPAARNRGGGLAAAAAFLERAVALTQDPSRRAERALAAAYASLQAGAFAGALRLVSAAEVGPLDEFQRARRDLLRGHVAFASGSGDAPSLLLKAARRLAPFDVALARETYLNAWGSASLTAHLDRGGGLMTVSRAIPALPTLLGDSGALDLLLDGLALLVTAGHAASAPIASAIEQGFPYAYLAAAVLYNGLARYEEAASAARHAVEASFEPWAHVWAMPELVEAAARTGDPEVARDALQQLAEATQPCGTAWALGIEGSLPSADHRGG